MMRNFASWLLVGVVALLGLGVPVALLVAGVRP
jgi:hypothetical protein